MFLRHSCLEKIENIFTVLLQTAEKFLKVVARHVFDISSGTAYNSPILSATLKLKSENLLPLNHTIEKCCYLL